MVKIRLKRMGKKKAFISSKPYIVLSSCTGRDLSNICSVNSCLFYVRKQSNFPIK